ncbi:type II secretion system F family protein [Gracilibacillus caseinilyticus]|uniref:Type II secretion system F family protein n=1 Tax=Gracilibacillus caseinilyticus TaxID=2932256 RepID=A0ABY4EU98_9BACI|nr:type II secretion system F family protein [Gracilibacillus caseinilyticus]UOQ47463.1 type II secretion system F family protein [Gracilibacillus caseinilyticus]
MHLDILLPFKRHETLSLQIQYQLLHRLELLFRHGYMLNDALDVLLWEKQMVQPARTIKRQLELGQSFVTALSRAHFHDDIVRFLETAIEHGNLADGLTQCCNLLQQRMNFTKKLRSLTRYPLFLFIFFFILLHLLKTSIFPALLQLLQTSQNGVFQQAIAVINIIYYGIITLSVILLLLFLFRFSFQRSITLETKIAVIQKIPIYFRYKRMQTTYLLITHLSSLLKSGLTMKECLEIIKHNQKEDIVHYYATHISSHLANGYQYSTILPHCKLLEPQLDRIMTKERNQDQLQKEFSLYAEHLIAAMERFIKSWLSFLQPLLLSILALFIVFVYLSLMLPMFDYIQTM